MVPGLLDQARDFRVLALSVVGKSTEGQGGRR